MNSVTSSLVHITITAQHKYTSYA